MVRRSSVLALRVLTAAVIPLLVAAPLLFAQHGSTGTIVVTVQDQTGAIVPAAGLELRDLATNDVRKAQTQEAGTYTFNNLPNGTYKLSISKAGYTTNIFDSVLVQASQTTNVKSTLTVGTITEVVVVAETATPLIETTSNAIGTAIDLKQIEDLPMAGRDLAQLSQLVPGYSNVPGLGGTWDGLPQTAQGNSIDGVASSTSRMKFGGNGEPDVQPRLENIQEMTVETEQLDMNQGFGAANMQVNFVTRRGTNAYHGRVFEDFRNTALNANSWANDALGLPKNVIILNEFGGSVGGPIIKDKLFFFGNFSMSKQPGTENAGSVVLNAAAQQGNFSYTDTNGNAQTVNVLKIAANQGFPGTVNSAVSSQLGLINGVLSQGALAANAGDPNTSTLNFQVAAPRTIYFPTFRIDYDISQKYRLTFAFNDTKGQPVPPIYQTYAPPPFPGKAFANRGAHNRVNMYTGSLGFDWTVSPTLINEFRAGYLYHAEFYGYDAPALWLPSSGQYAQVNWALGNSGEYYQTPTGTYYPTFNVSDTITLQHKAHNIKFGFSMYREQDHYYNNPVGWPTLNLGLVGGDPAVNVFSNGSGGTLPNASQTSLNEAVNLYATLVGRITGISGSYAYDQKTNAYSSAPQGYFLDELQSSWGLFAQDSWRFRPNLTVNFGLRWDFTGDNHDLTSAYHQAFPSAVFGPSGVWNVFNPGSLQGDQDPTLIATTHQYHPWNVSPQPALGFAWDVGGDGKTVVRGGASLRRYTEPQQYFWDNASDYGSFFYQFFQTNASNAKGAGFFTPGSLSWGGPQGVAPCDVAAGQPCPPYLLAPAAYQKVAPESEFTFVNNWYANDAHGIDPYIKQPYTTSWNLGVQRQLTKDNVIEVRYVGSRSVHQWVSLQTNEVNIFQSGQYGFLTNFKAAQANLAANNASGNPNYAGSFANHNLAGQAPTPLFDAAFAGEKAGVDGALIDYTNAPFVQDLTNGAAGVFAQAMTTTSGTTNYFCNLVGSGFAPCVNNVGFAQGVAGVVPINFFQANPFNSGIETSYMTNLGYATHNGLQVDFRQKQFHGMQFDANYTWSHTLGTNPTNNWTGVITQFSLRYPHMNYGPTLDLRHVIHANGTYDLPFGKGKALLSQNKWLDRVVGGWTIGAILTYQTGSPFQMGGGFGTFNDYADGGINLNGLTVSQLQQSIGVHHVSAAQNGGSAVNFVDVIDPKYMAGISGGGANSTFITPNSSPGTFGLHPWLYGPHLFDLDMSLNKRVPITERIRFSLQTEFLNVLNHPNFGTPDAGVQDFGFGTTVGTTSAYPNSPNNGARMLELRANIEF